ncbi:MAG: radical SAM protein [Candidatus Omnitrophota bacterium]|nr:MAG: radical SAM protein [Candidatus Omnitrophota bacterium]
MTSKSDTRDFYVASAPPLGLYRLQHYIAGRGIKCDVLDLGVQRELEEKYLRMVEEGLYDIVGMSVTHRNMIPELETIWKFRVASEKSKKRCLFIAGGQDATLNYKQWLNSGIDLILLGFAEKSLYELCLRLSKGQHIETGKMVEGMAGCAVRNSNNQIIYQPSEILTDSEFKEFSFSQIMELDIPYEIYWKDLGKLDTVANFHENKFVAKTVRLYTASHCPMNCGYCSSRSFIPESQKRKSPVFMLSASEVHQLIVHHVKKYGAMGFLFCEDDFMIGSPKGIQRVVDVCRLIARSKEDGTIPEDTLFNCQARIDDFLIRKGPNKKVVNLEVMDVLKRAGFRGFGIGVETFSDRLLKCKSVNKFAYSYQDSRLVLDSMLEKGLNPTINLILAIPESTVEDMVHSMEVAVEYFEKGCQMAVSALMDSFPGSTIHGTKDYPATTKEWKNPYTKEIVSIDDYFIPKNDRIASITSRFREVSSDELEKLKIDASWTNSAVPKPITGLSNFIGISKLLGKHDLAKRFRDVTYEALCKETIFS